MGAVDLPSSAVRTLAHEAHELEEMFRKLERTLRMYALYAGIKRVPGLIADPQSRAAIAQRGIRKAGLLADRRRAQERPLVDYQTKRRTKR
jgi:hypothetical protein